MAQLCPSADCQFGVIWLGGDLAELYGDSHRLYFARRQNFTNSVFAKIDSDMISICGGLADPITAIKFGLPSGSCVKQQVKS